MSHLFALEEDGRTSATYKCVYCRTPFPLAENPCPGPKMTMAIDVLQQLVLAIPTCDHCGRRSFYCSPARQVRSCCPSCRGYPREPSYDNIVVAENHLGIYDITERCALCGSLKRKPDGSCTVCFAPNQKEAKEAALYWDWEASVAAGQPVTNGGHAVPFWITEVVVALRKQSDEP